MSGSNGVTDPGMPGRPYRCLNCHETFSEVHELSSHMLGHSKEKRYSCKLCGKRFIIKRTLLKHLKIHRTNVFYKACDNNKTIPHIKDEFPKPVLHIHVEQSASLSPKKRKRYKNNRITLQDFMVCRKRQNTDQKNKKKSTKPMGMNRQKLDGKSCSLTFLTEVDHERHSKTHKRKKNHRCLKCSFSFTNLLMLHWHTVISHRNQTFQCDICLKIFKQKEVLTWHKKQHESNHELIIDRGCEKRSFLNNTRDSKKPNVCKICKKAFSSSSCLSRHQRVHTGEKPYRCEECGLGFCERSVLVAHSVKHTGIPLERKYKCEYCEKAFTRSSILRSHIHTHGDKTHKCKYCNKLFSHQKILTRHLTTHTMNKEFRCQFCDRNFLTKSNMKRHLRVHTGERPYKCDTCDKTFTQEVNLKSHSYVHSSKKPFSCEICGREFTQKGNLRNHKHIHMGSRLFECHICKKTFAQQSNLRNHKTTVHKKTKRSRVCGGTENRGTAFPPTVMDTAISWPSFGTKTAIASTQPNIANYSNNTEHSMKHTHCHGDVGTATVSSGDIILEAVCSAEILQPPCESDDGSRSSRDGSREFLQLDTRGQQSENDSHMLYKHPAHVICEDDRLVVEKLSSLNEVNGSTIQHTYMHSGQLSRDTANIILPGETVYTNTNLFNTVHPSQLSNEITVSQSDNETCTPENQIGHHMRQQIQGQSSNLEYVRQTAVHPYTIQSHINTDQYVICTSCSCTFASQYELYQHSKVCFIYRSSMI